jgi:hypothetical protein
LSRFGGLLFRIAVDSKHLKQAADPDLAALSLFSPRLVRRDGRGGRARTAAFRGE